MAKKIYINPGHTDTDPGAVGYEVERELILKVSNYMYAYLLGNYKCLIRMKSGNLNDIARDANRWGADLVVSNHFNAFKKDKGDGYEALIYSEGNMQLGKCFEKHVVAIGQNSRGVKVRPDLAILRLTNAPAVLNEGAFVDTWDDIKDWNDDDELKELGIAYAKAAAEYLKLPKRTGRKQPYKGTLPLLPARDYLRKGDKGLQVKRLQRLLNWAIDADLVVDGDFGSKTLDAVKLYQKTYGLVVDGFFGPASLSTAEIIKK